MKNKREKLFDKVVQVSEKTDSEYPDKVTNRNLAIYKRKRSKKTKSDFILNLPSGERTALRKRLDELSA
jgi:hypothetical protein